MTLPMISASKSMDQFGDSVEPELLFRSCIRTVSVHILRTLACSLYVSGMIIRFYTLLLRVLCRILRLQGVPARRGPQGGGSSVSYKPSKITAKPIDVQKDHSDNFKNSLFVILFQNLNFKPY